MGKNQIQLELMKFSTRAYLFDHGLIPANEGILGFKLLIHDGRNILVGQRLDEVGHLPGYGSLVGVVFDQLGI